MTKGIKKLQISFGEQHITRFGGMYLIHKFCQKMKLKWYLQKYVRVRQHHENYQVSELILIILYSIIVGILRIDTTRPLQYNGVFQDMLGLKRVPDPTSIRRFLHRLPTQTIRQIVRVHNLLQLKLFPVRSSQTSVIFDIDPTAVTVYGTQQRTKKGYNPKKRGRRCYSVFLCFESNHQEFWLGTLRSGNIAPVRLAPHLVKRCIAKLPKSVRRIRVRADAAFYSHRFIERCLEKEKIKYTVEVQISNIMRSKFLKVKYQPYKKDWEVGEFYYQPETHVPGRWKTMHRFVVQRRPLPEDPKEAAQLSFFEMQGYGYRVIVTNLTLKPRHVWNFHNQRASGAELNIKELKYNYPLNKIPTQSYIANIGYLQLLMFSFNIINWFKRLYLPGRYRYKSLHKIRQDLLVVPARLVRTGNRKTLKFPMGYPYQDLLKDILNKINRTQLT